MRAIQPILSRRQDGTQLLRWRGIDVLLRDTPGSNALEAIAHDFLCNRYGLDALELRPGDLVLDVGAHVGAVSIFCALRWPQAVVHAYEPMPANFDNLAWALRENGVRNVLAWNEALSGDGRTLHLGASPSNSGSASAFLPGARDVHAASVSLATALRRASAARCRFLKMDCEGMEHELLRDPAVAGRADLLAVEIHASDALRAAGHDAAKLQATCRERFGERLLRSHVCDC
ncbi:FkbM family methyltransferase [Ramlibacter sp. G-1-2-2]|uniref:FkbM family methyltransferase n=1 Tax=Ramlibacter agri TaxID=2728837 RepID=A0A848GZX3_9BURK|nr:FkbM family methyltransferase [Ramlibacter agri]